MAENELPDRNIVELRFRVPLSYSLKKLRSQLDRLLETIKGEEDVEIKIERISYVKAETVSTGTKA
jgi:acetylornithine deacetylase/succinyl-diaminopimelate desuccinylase-like protein